MNKIWEHVSAPLEDPRFYRQVYQHLSENHPEEYTELSRALDAFPLQESVSVRNNLRARALAQLLVNEEGEILVDQIPALLESLRQNQYSLGPGRHLDAKRQEHFIHVLSLLHQTPALVRQLKMISKPSMHRIAEQVIKETLLIPQKTILTDAHARRAVLSAWLCYLRQNVGSCFATAPAILVQHEQPQVFLQDMKELLATGQLKRTFGGVEYAVPLSYTWGAGDLRKGFFFSKTAVEDSPLWKAPGLILALEAAELIKGSAGEKEQQAKALLLNVIKDWKGSGDWFYTSIERLLKKVLLDKLFLTEQELEDYELRPQSMMMGSSLLRLPVASGTGGVAAKAQAYQALFERAKSAFKSLTDNALLKTWEFTIASFSETKAQFTTWNLYSSLGLKPDDKGGIGPQLYEILKRKLEECNEKVQQFQFEYEQLHTQLQYLQRRTRDVSSEREGQWARIEYQTKASEFHALEDLRNDWHHKARRYSNLYEALIDLYYNLFPRYFQEVYDADIHEVTAGPYDDSPAGFRLLFKHGRSNTAQWTLIHNAVEFVDALTNFFNSTESELANAPEFKGIEADLSEIVTNIVSHVRSKEFLESAFHRMARAHNAPLVRDPLDNLDKVTKKPWVYTSGGAITTLISCYFKLESKPKEVTRWVDNPMELLVYLIDTVKEIPDKIIDEFSKNREKSLLMHSPTHAFLLKPGYPLFYQALQPKEFTYTWARDHVVRPLEDFVNKIFLDDEKMKFIVDHLLEMVPPPLRHYFKETFYSIGGSMHVTDFRNHMLAAIDMSPGLRQGNRGALTAEQIDAALYALLPLFPRYQLVERAAKILMKLPGISHKEELIAFLDEHSGKAGAPKNVSAKGLREILLSLIAIREGKITGSIDYQRLIHEAAQSEGFAMPAPFIFADTNWVKEHFAFTVNPGTGKIELWRMDPLGLEGAPMNEWEMWLNGSRKEPNWGVFNRPYEYRY